jgi:hypothetical protein
MRKCYLQSSEFMVLCDLTDISSFMLLGEGPGFYWNNAQVTIHPLVTYLNESYTLNTEQDNLVLVPNCLKHDCLLIQYHPAAYNEICRKKHLICH